MAQGLARAAMRDDGEARFEAKGEEFHERLRQAFLHIARREPDRCVVVDAEGTMEAIEARIWAAVSERLSVAA